MLHRHHMSSRGRSKRWGTPGRSNARPRRRTSRIPGHAMRSGQGWATRRRYRTKSPSGESKSRRAAARLTLRKSAHSGSRPARSRSEAMTAVRSRSNFFAAASAPCLHESIIAWLHSVIKWYGSSGVTLQSAQGFELAAWSVGRPPSVSTCDAKRGDSIAAAPVRAHAIGPRRGAATLLRVGMDPEQPGPCALKGVNCEWFPREASGAV